jgi:hypothetical protein
MQRRRDSAIVCSGVGRYPCTHTCMPPWEHTSTRRTYVLRVHLCACVRVRACVCAYASARIFVNMCALVWCATKHTCTHALTPPRYAGTHVYANTLTASAPPHPVGAGAPLLGLVHARWSAADTASGGRQVLGAMTMTTSGERQVLCDFRRRRRRRTSPSTSWQQWRKVPPTPPQTGLPPSRLSGERLGAYDRRCCHRMRKLCLKSGRKQFIAQ